MKITMQAIESIKPYAKNPRINEPAVPGVVASLKEYGWRQPIVVDKKGVIIVGHTRYKAAKELGLKKVPVHVASELTPTQVRAYRLADNKTSEASEWDFELLAFELRDLQAANYDLGLAGFSDLDLTKLLAESNEGLTDPDEVPPLPPKAKTKPGMLYQLGKHRLLCGDSSKAEDVDRLLGGAKIHLVNSDPPYNVKVEPRSNNAVAAGLSSFGGLKNNQARDAAKDPGKAKRVDKVLRPKDRPLANDFVSDEEFDRLLLAWFGNMSRVLLPGRSFYIWGGFANVANYPSALKASKLFFAQAVIWVKHHPVLTRKDFMTDHEWCFYGWREGAGHKWFGPNNATDVWEVKKVPNTKMVHLTEKPTELAQRAMEYSSQPGENVLDFFGGSGSTLIAAEMLGRNAFLTEIDPLYCDVIVERWQNFTGKKAVLVQ